VRHEIAVTVHDSWIRNYEFFLEFLARNGRRGTTHIFSSLFEKMEIVGIEFDRFKFDSPSVCENWMRSLSTNSDLQYVLNLKTFRLKSTPCVFLSDEKRKVWSWYNMWDCKQLTVARPNPNVVIICKISSVGRWDATDVPVPLQATQEKRQKLELLRQKKEYKRREMIERAKSKRKASRKGASEGGKHKEKRPRKKKEVVKAEAPLSPILPPSILEAESGLLNVTEDPLTGTLVLKESI